MTGCDVLWEARSCVPCCVWRCVRRCARSDVAPCAVIAAVRDDVRACGACVLYAVCDVRCTVRGLLVCAVLGDTPHDADVVLWWVGLVMSCVCARVCGVMVGSAALVGIRARCASGLRNCKELWLRRTSDVECASWACIAGAVSSALSRALCRYGSIAIARCFTASRCDCCVTAQRCAGLCLWLIARVPVSCCAAYTRALPPRCSGGAVFCACVVGD